jgi:hypothetical protein
MFQRRQFGNARDNEPVRHASGDLGCPSQVIEPVPLRRYRGSACSQVTGRAYLIVGVAGAIWPGHWDDAAASDQIVWAVLLIAGGLLVLAGLRLLQRAPARGGMLVSIGAVVGALPIFWALVPLLLAVALIVLSVVYARRAPRAAV